MMRVLLVACVVVLVSAEPEAVPMAEAEPAAEAAPLFIPHNQEQYHDDDDHHDRSGHRLTHIPRGDYSRQHKIIESVFSPDYAEPTIVLDYRYLKSGGRDYVRGPGGQVIILPKNVRNHEPKEHSDYDSLIEYLRIKNSRIAEAGLQRHIDVSQNVGHHNNDEHRDNHAHQTHQYGSQWH